MLDTKETRKYDQCFTEQNTNGDTGLTSKLNVERWTSDHLIMLFSFTCYLKRHSYEILIHKRLWHWRAQIAFSGYTTASWHFSLPQPMLKEKMSKKKVVNSDVYKRGASYISWEALKFKHRLRSYLIDNNDYVSHWSIRFYWVDICFGLDSRSKHPC